VTVVLLHVSLEVKDRQIKGKTCVCRIGKFTEGVARYGIASQKMCVCVCMCVCECVCVCVCVCGRLQDGQIKQGSCMQVKGGLQIHKEGHNNRYVYVYVCVCVCECVCVCACV